MEGGPRSLSVSTDILACSPVDRISYSLHGNRLTAGDGHDVVVFAEASGMTDDEPPPHLLVAIGHCGVGEGFMHHALVPLDQID